MFKQYDGSLDHLNPVQIGEDLFNKGEPIDDDNDPTYPFYNDDNDFLEVFRSKMLKAWYKARENANLNAFKAQLPAFQAQLPEVGETRFIEYPSNPGNYYECVIEYIPPERDQVLIRYEKTTDEGRSNLHLVGYVYPGKFPILHKDDPRKNNTK